MEKGFSKRILCDTCRTIITNTDYITVKGKKRTLHYCDKDKCITDEQRLQALGYNKLSKITWNEHCKKCKSHPIDGCAKNSPEAVEFFGDIVYQKKIEGFIIEYAKSKGIYSRIGCLFIPKSNNKTVVRLFHDILDPLFTKYIQKF